jgi:hypothetical protein
MSRLMKWAFLSVVGAVSFFALPASADAQGISIGLYGNNGGVFYQSNPYVQPYYPAYYAPQVFVPVAPRPYPVYYGGGYPGRYYGRPNYGHGHHGHHHHHHHR